MDAASVGYWLAPVVLCLFVLAMAVIGILLCYKLRKPEASATQSQDKCNCKHRSRTNKAKSFLSNSIFFTKTSEVPLDSPLYKQCRTSCHCEPSACKHCKDDTLDAKYGLLTQYNGSAP